MRIWGVFVFCFVVREHSPLWASLLLSSYITLTYVLLSSTNYPGSRFTVHVFPSMFIVSCPLLIIFIDFLQKKKKTRRCRQTCRHKPWVNIKLIHAQTLLTTNNDHNHIYIIIIHHTHTHTACEREALAPLLLYYIYYSISIPISNILIIIINVLLLYILLCLFNKHRYNKEGER